MKEREDPLATHICDGALSLLHLLGFDRLTWRFRTCRIQMPPAKTSDFMFPFDLLLNHNSRGARERSRVTGSEAMGSERSERKPCTNLRKKKNAPTRNRHGHRGPPKATPSTGAANSAQSKENQQVSHGR